MPFPKVRIPIQVQLLLTFVGGALAMFVWHSVGSSNALNANLTEDALNRRSKGVIATQKEEINRLRRELQACGKEDAAKSASDQPAVRTCTKHRDCPGWTSICKNNVCTTLNSPICACQTSDTHAYILCIANEGAGPDARNISCGSKRCSNDPKPHCVNE